MTRLLLTMFALLHCTVDLDRFLVLLSSILIMRMTTTMTIQQCRDEEQSRPWNDDDGADPLGYASWHVSAQITKLKVLDKG